MPPATTLSSMPGSVALVALRRPSHICGTAGAPGAAAYSTMPFRCTAYVCVPKKRAAARSIGERRIVEAVADRIDLVAPAGIAPSAASAPIALASAMLRASTVS
jgi:hypothetical protein